MLQRLCTEKANGWTSGVQEILSYLRLTSLPVQATVKTWTAVALVLHHRCLLTGLVAIGNQIVRSTSPQILSLLRMTIHARDVLEVLRST